MVSMTELKKLQYTFSEEMKRGVPTPLVMKFGGGLNDTLAFDDRPPSNFDKAQGLDH